MLYCLFSSEACYSSQRQQHLGGMFSVSIFPLLAQASLAKATTSRRDVFSKYFPSPGTSFPRKGNNCKPSLVACVSPISPGASVKGELLPTLAARTCFTFEFVSPYLLCKPNLDDTCRLSHCCKPGSPACVSPISPGASVKGELLPTLAARTCFHFRLFRLIYSVSQIWMIQADSSTAASLCMQLVFGLICFVSRIWMIHTKSQQELFIKK